MLIDLCICVLVALVVIIYEAIVLESVRIAPEGEVL